jgi:hypothetical protein
VGWWVEGRSAGVAVPAGRPAPLGELAPGRRVDPAAADEFLALYQAENPRVGSIRYYQTADLRPNYVHHPPA